MSPDLITAAPIAAHALAGVLAVSPVPDLCVGPMAPLCAAGEIGGGIAGGVSGGLGGAAADLALGGLGHAFVAGARDASSAVLAALDATTRVDLSAAWFRRNTAVLAAVTLPVVVGLFVLQVAGAALRREPGGLARAVVGVGKALLGASLALAGTQAALLACDEIATAIASAAGTTVREAAERFLSMTVLAGPQIGPVLQVLLGLAVIVGSFLLWAVLLFRKAALLVVAVFAPVAFAGAAWDHTRGWVRRWVEIVAALVFSKVVIVVVFVVGASAFSTDGTATTATATAGRGAETAGASLSDLLVGLLLLGIAAFAPWLSWRFVHFTGSEMAEAMHHTVARSPLPAAPRAAGRMAQQAAVSAATSGLASGIRAGGSAASGSVPGGSVAGGNASSDSARGSGPRPPRPPAPPSTGGDGRGDRQIRPRRPRTTSSSRTGA